MYIEHSKYSNCLIIEDVVWQILRIYKLACFQNSVKKKFLYLSQITISFLIKDFQQNLY